MKIQYMDDLHLEFGNPILPMNNGDTDLLILAGDIFVAYDFIDQNPKRRKLYNKFLSHISEQFPAVIIVAGNHEMYRWRSKEITEYGSYLNVLREHIGKYRNITFLENEYIDFGDIRFVGATLWTDFGNANPLIMAQAESGMNDYRTSGYTTNDVLLWHRESMHFIEKTVAEHRKLVIITHHAPSYLSVHPDYKTNNLNGAYATELFDFIIDNPQIIMWFHGHMHHTDDYVIGSTKVLRNPFGYNHLEENKAFNKKACVEVPGGLNLGEVVEN